MSASERCKAEILAPAGGPESLVAAARCGADAVYLGGKSLNARRGAANFDDAALAEATAYCHARGVKVYLTLNTLVFDDELDELDRALAAACAAGVDALIVQDLAVAALARERAPSLPLHASTQMSVHDAKGAQALEALGFSRVVLARELSREEIAAIRAESAIELECFVHGALCMSVSGQCYLSAMIGGRSGNRGLCAQPCRLPFSAGGREYALSLRDLSLIASAAEMADSGIRALKIEGRMKRPEYVAAAVTACRQALEGQQPDYAALEAVFSRAGFTRGYYDARRGCDMFGIRRKEDVQSAQPVLKKLAALYKDERQSVPVSLAFSLKRGRAAALRAEDTDGNRVEVAGPPPEEARTAPTDAERAAAALSKTGGTPYTIRNFSSDIDEGLILPAAQLNALRREALELLTRERGRPRPHPYSGGVLPETAPYRREGAQWLRARLSRAEQLSEPLAEAAREIVLPARELARLEDGIFARHREKWMVELPAVDFDNPAKIDELLQMVKSRGVTAAITGNLGGIRRAQELGYTVRGDYGLNITNSISMREYANMGLRDLTASFELDLRRLRALGGETPRGILAYGFLPLMTMRNCPAGDCGRCSRDFPAVTDRKGNRFFVDCGGDRKVARLYNCVPLVIADCLRDFACADFLTLYFTREGARECAEIAELYRTGGQYGGNRTKGLYYRGVG